MNGVIEELDSKGARIIGTKILVNYSIAKVVLQKFTEQEKANLTRTAQNVIQEYRNQFGNSFQPIAANNDQRSSGIFRNASGVLAKNDEYFVKNS